MTARKVWSGGQWVELGGGAAGSLVDQYPSPPTSDGVTSASSTRSEVSLSTHATVAHSPGAWVVLDSSLAVDAHAVDISFRNATSTSGADTSTILEIGTGGSGSETVWAQVLVGYGSIAALFTVPGILAAGTRVVARLRSIRLGATHNSIGFAFMSGAGKSVAPGAPVSMGIDTANSRGVVLTAPGSLNTKGAWTEIEDATPADFGALAVSMQGAGGTAMASSPVLVDVGIGAAGAESVLIGDLCLVGTSGEEFTYHRGCMRRTFGVDVPAGSRLSARYARAASGNAIDLALVGTPAA